MSGNKQRLWIVVLFLLLISSASISACGTPSAANATPTPIPAAARQATPTLEPTATASPTAPPLPSAQVEFPLALNNTWVFHVTRYEGVPITEILATTLVITETVFEVKNTSSFFIATIHREESAEIGMVVPPSWQGVPLRPATSSDYWLVVSGNRIYRQENKLDLSKLGEALLKFVFPLQVGAKWYQADNALPRLVTKVDTVIVPAGQFKNCFFLQEEWVDATFEEWFCPKVGIVDKKGDHHGTPVGYRQVLINYQLKE